MDMAGIYLLRTPRHHHTPIHLLSYTLSNTFTHIDTHSFLYTCHTQTLLRVFFIVSCCYHLSCGGSHSPPQSLSCRCAWM
jgi:hypothetical protein